MWTEEAAAVVIAALAAPLVGAALSARRVDARLLSQARGDLELLGQVDDPLLAQDLRSAAHKGIRQALKLRATARELAQTLAVAGGSTLIVVAVPVYLVLVPSAGIGLAGRSWLIMWWIYVAAMLGSWGRVAYLTHRRRKILDGAS